MATTDFTIDDASTGSVLTPANGFLVNLSRTKAPPPGPPKRRNGRRLDSNGSLAVWFFAARATTKICFASTRRTADGAASTATKPT